MIRILSLQFLFIALPIMLFAQSNSSKGSFREHLKEKEAERKTAVNEYARQNKIPITGTGADGEFMYLYRIDNNKPVYYTTRGDNNNLSTSLPLAYIRMDKNEWMPLENDIKIAKGNSVYLSIKSDESIIGAYMLNSEGRYFYKSNRLDTKELSISTKKMHQDEYVLCIKTEDGTSVYNIHIQ